MTNFDLNKRWLIDRGDGSGLPSVNLVVLSFVNPLKLPNRTTDSGNLNGVPVSMNQAVVNYFKSRNIRVMLSIGCNNFNASLQNATSSYVTSVNGRVGTTSGMLGFMFWAAEMPSTSRITTAPPNSCEAGVGAGASVLGVPFPMPALRQS